MILATEICCLEWSSELSHEEASDQVGLSDIYGYRDSFDNGF
jgi:hypothetical protein